MILFVDDEGRRMDSYVRELKDSEYEVSFQDNVDAAWEFFERNVDQVELLILDIMMPPGNRFRDHDTKQGLRTGIHFYEKVRATAPDLPIMILTNVSDSEVEKRFYGESLCWFQRKEDYLPFEIVEEVAKILA